MTDWYEWALARATERAASHPVSDTACYSVWRRRSDPAVMSVQASEAIKPYVDCELVCIAQRWDDTTVQLRFTGARSEWRSI